MNLNHEQQQAVQHVDGPVCIVAGPGSGKTFTLVERIYHLIHDRGVIPENILVITFTNKAAGEIRTRVTARLQSKDILHPQTAHLQLPFIETFHSLCLHILQTYVARTGFPKGFEVLSEAAQKKIINTIAKTTSYKGGELRDLISRHKVSHTAPILEELQDPLEQYQQALAKAQQLDFDDLLIYTVELFKTHSDILTTYQEQFHYIMVDEYQDTNALQAELLELLSPPHHNICIIGDPNQAIYGFRGARREHFFRFGDVYPAAQRVQLRDNYRSCERLVRIGDGFIGETGTRAARKGGAHLHLVEAPTGEAEARYIVETVSRLLGGIDMTQTDGQVPDHHVYQPSDIAVLFRIHAIGAYLETFFRDSGIPCTRVGKTAFFERPEVKNIIEQLKSLALTKRVAEHIREIAGELGGESSWLEELIARARVYDTLAPEDGKQAFLAEASLEESEREVRPQEDAVTLLTAHAAKGLEFPVVFIAGVEEGLFPYQPTTHNQQPTTEEVEEEKRLLYVAMTRAKDELYLTYAKQRRLFGETTIRKPSRFLKDIPEKLVQKIVLTPKPKKEKPPQQKLF